MCCTVVFAFAQPSWSCVSSIVVRARFSGNTGLKLAFSWSAVSFAHSMFSNHLASTVLHGDITVF